MLQSKDVPFIARPCVALVGSMAFFALPLPDASATPIAAATASEAPSGSNFQYSLQLQNKSATPGTAANAIGTFWFAWVPGKDFLQTSPLTVNSPTGWQDAITHGGSGDGYAIQWTTISSSSDLAAGASLNGFSFTTADPPSSVFGNSFFYPTTPTLTAVAYEAAPFSDGGNTFVVSTPEPAMGGLLGLLGIGMLARRRRQKFTAHDDVKAGNTV
jgi:hypothetical protein